MPIKEHLELSLPEQRVSWFLSSGNSLIISSVRKTGYELYVAIIKVSTLQVTSSSFSLSSALFGHLLLIHVLCLEKKNVERGLISFSQK